MNNRQTRVMELLCAPKKSTGYKQRDIYEGASAANPKQGSGEYWVTDSAGQEYKPLNKRDVDELVTLGLIRQKWPGCYELATKNSTKEPS